MKTNQSKKYTLTVVALALLGFGITGCTSMQTHEHSQGSIAALDGPTEAHVCMNSKSVNVGDKLSIFQVTCTQKRTGVPGSKYNDPSVETICQKTAKGSAEVTGKSDEHFVKVKSVNGAPLKEGYVIEKFIQ